MASHSHTYLLGGPKGTDLGPFALEEVKSMIAKGEVQGSTVIKRSDAEHWSTAAEFPELSVQDVVEVPGLEKSAMALASEEMGREIYARTIRFTGIWFFWIGAMSLINSIVVFLGGKWGFVLGLELTHLLGEAGRSLGSTGTLGVFALNLVLSLLFVGFGVAAWHTKYKPFLIGLALYAGDLLSAVLAFEIVGIVVHCIALFSLYKGLNAFLDRDDQPLKPALSFAIPVALITAIAGVVVLLLFSPKSRGDAPAAATAPHAMFAQARTRSTHLPM